MENKQINRIFAAFTFLFSFVIYYLTVAPTVSYWDCGEFIACSYKLAIPHPPGAPLYLLVGRIFTLLPIFPDIAKRVNLISTLSSAFTIMFLYLTIVIFIRQLVQEAKNRLPVVKAKSAVPPVSSISTADRLIPYIGGMIGALTFAFTTSFWFNAVEAEVYAPSMLFTSLVVWLVMYWSERSEQIGNEKYLLIIMYLVGLATGVHLLNVLALPMVFLIIYYKKYPLTTQTFALMVIIGVILTAMIYPGMVQGIPKIADWVGFTGLFILILGFIVLMVHGVRSRRHVLSLLVTSLLLITLGYSTYFMIYIRSGLDPNIDENNPETVEKFISYMEREQYGEHTLDRDKVWRESPNKDRYQNSNQFFWEYQINRMYNRYFLWNFLGKSDTSEEISFFKFLMIPFLLGLFGAIYHFNKDWKRALAVFTLFFMTGLAIILYLNQPDPQPRERDYSYVGSFFAFAIWIGIGSAGILQMLREKIEDPSTGRLVTMAVAGLLFIAAPLQVMVKNYAEHDRSGNYVAWDYSYNMLVSCEPNGILYTNGDNDTFPLWYLQEVENVRTDVRVANLSLLNTNWYVAQLKAKEPKVPISFKDDEIERLQPIPWPKTETIEINMPEQFVEKEWSEFQSGYKLGNASRKEQIKFDLSPKLIGRYLRVQDLMILNTLYANKFRKPIYFAVTTSRDNMLDGLQRYLRMDGLVFKVTGLTNWSIQPDLLYDNLVNKYRYRNLDNPDVFFNDNIISLLQNYRSAFVQLANYYANTGEDEKIGELMKIMREKIPPEVIPYTNQMLKNWIGAYEIHADLRPVEELDTTNYSEQDLEEMGRLLASMNDRENAQVAFEAVIAANPENYRAKGYLVDIYGKQQKFQQAINILEEWVAKNPNDNSSKKRLEEYRQKLKEKESS
ncbi:MAG: DUF2723 domain-containing protein [Calditrichia bacterium]